MHNHYDVLGLTEAASTNAVKKAYLFGEWHGYNDDVPDSLKIEQLDEAYAQLGDPVKRLVYDTQEGFSQRHLSSRIGGAGYWWRTWAICFGLLSFLVLFALQENISRLVGSNFAPEFREDRYYVDREVCIYEESKGKEVCREGYFESWFYSSNSFWEWSLNSRLGLPLASAMLTGAIGLLGGIYIHIAIARIIASVRYAGNSDRLVRAGADIIVLGLPFTVAVFLVWQ
jgi:curved DNA-binding protein CbpA